MSDDYRTFIANADPQALIHQLNLELKDPLVSAQAVVNMLVMMQNPSPGMQQKLESGELDPAQMLQQISEAITRTLDVIDYYRETLNDS